MKRLFVLPLLLAGMYFGQQIHAPHNATTNRGYGVVIIDGGSSLPAGWEYE